LITKIRDLDDNQLWKVVISKHKSMRSLDQNEYYWELITQLANDIGHTKDEMHQLMTFKFLTSKKIVNGEKIFTIKSTSKLNSKEFTEYIDNIKSWAKEYVGFNFGDNYE
jgi:uncharacterized protein (DUF2344 family)